MLPVVSHEMRFIPKFRHKWYTVRVSGKKNVRRYILICCFDMILRIHATLLALITTPGAEIELL